MHDRDIFAKISVKAIKFTLRSRERLMKFAFKIIMHYSLKYMFKQIKPQKLIADTYRHSFLTQKTKSLLNRERFDVILSTSKQFLVATLRLQFALGK